MLLAGDVGGTKTDLAVYSAEKGPREPLARGELPCADYPSLGAVLRAFLARIDLPVDTACIGVAGPVIAGRARITNLPWAIDAAGLAEELGLRAVHLLNDLEAIGLAVSVLEPADVRTLSAGERSPGGAVAVIAPGTGLGEGFLTWDGSRYRAHPSEGGHADFAPASSAEVGLLQYLWQRYDHVSVERVCSGLGIPNLYDYHLSAGHAPESPGVAARLAASADRTPIIVETALDPIDPCPLSVMALETFVSILGAEAGNLALKVLATGGVYVGGGIPPRILPLLEGEHFLQAFRRKGRFAELLARVPVHVIVTRAGLLGAASYGLEMARSTG